MMSNTTFETQKSLDSEKVAFASDQADFSNPNRQLHTAFITKNHRHQKFGGIHIRTSCWAPVSGSSFASTWIPARVPARKSSRLLTVPQKGVMNLCWKMMKRQQISPTVNLLSGVPISRHSQNQKRKPTSSSSLFKASKSSGPKTVRELEFRGKIRQRSGEQSA